MPDAPSQRATASALLQQHGMMRLTELRTAGITAATISRMVGTGEVIRLARGIYQLRDAPLDINHSLAEASKRVPRGVICLVSALAFHVLTDQLPRKIWMAIGEKDWAPTLNGTPIRVARFSKPLLSEGVEIHVIESVAVKVFGIGKTVVDCFRHRNKVGVSIAIEGLQEALRQRKATPAQIHSWAKSGGVSTVVRPYLEALTANS